MDRNAIMEKLIEVDPVVHYGTAEKHDRSAPWDYMVLACKNFNRTASRTGYSDYFEVAIVREEFIPEGLPERVIAAMESLPKVRLAEGSHDYEYAAKPDSNDTVEMLVLKFVAPRKRGPDD
ncbi:MAG: hypothetical protein IKL97_01930 [Eggerthellaceae bacterium]|nr:hypothetical protein [Eggerthellaceae bacterium]